MPCPTLTLRLVKGSPLTEQEGDDNLTTLRDFTNALEAHLDVALNPDGSLKNPPTHYAASATGTDTYAVTLNPVPAAMSDLIGKVLVLKADAANNGAATLNCNTLGDVAIKKNVTDALVTGDILAGQIVLLVYDGTNFQKV